MSPRSLLNTHCNILFEIVINDNECIKRISKKLEDWKTNKKVIVLPYILNEENVLQYATSKIITQ